MEILNYGQLKEHLLSVIDYADNEVKCTRNRSMTKGQYWNILMGICIKKNDETTVSELLVRNTLTEFPEWMRCDYMEI